MTDGGWRTRVRINHSRTIKEGWGHETTVEVEWLGDGEEVDFAAEERIAHLLNLADEIARAETGRRRAAEAEGRATA
jgi:hypothetical protein